jgi:hypothetical protein
MEDERCKQNEMKVYRRREMDSSKGEKQETFIAHEIGLVLQAARCRAPRGSNRDGTSLNRATLTAERALSLSRSPCAESEEKTSGQGPGSGFEPCQCVTGSQRHVNDHFVGLFWCARMKSPFSTNKVAVATYCT